MSGAPSLVQVVGDGDVSGDIPHHVGNVAAPLESTGTIPVTDDK